MKWEVVVHSDTTHYIEFYCEQRPHLRQLLYARRYAKDNAILADVTWFENGMKYHIEVNAGSNVAALLADIGSYFQHKKIFVNC